MIKVMSFNILCHGGEGHDWFDRAQDVTKTVRLYEPDIFGLQEAHYDWMQTFFKNFPDYNYSGVGRDDGDKDGEFSPVFYKKDKFDLLDQGTFWISETPTVPSKSWNSCCNRVCSWARLREKNGGNEFVAVNTHLDHISEEARRNGVRMINEFAATLDCPTVLTGDFNIPEKTDCYVDMINGKIFRDCKFSAEKTQEHFTFHEFYHHNEKREIIDYIFISDGFNAKSYHVADDKIDGRWPSDHCPVVAKIEFK